MAKRVGFVLGSTKAIANSTYKKAVLVRDIGTKKEGTIYRIAKWSSK